MPFTPHSTVARSKNGGMTPFVKRPDPPHAPKSTREPPFPRRQRPPAPQSRKGSLASSSSSDRGTRISSWVSVTMPSPAARSATAVSAEARRSSVDRVPSDDGAAADSVSCGESTASGALTASDVSATCDARERLVALLAPPVPPAILAPPVLPAPPDPEV